MDMILTGREVGPDEAEAMGLANRRAPAGEAVEAAELLARQIAAFPQLCMRTDRRSALGQWGLDEETALTAEISGGMDVIRSGETVEGATAFKAGKGRHGEF